VIQESYASALHDAQVAVVAYDEPFVMPDWVGAEFSQAGIGFAAANCHSETEVIALGRDKDVLLTSSARRLLTATVIQQLPMCRALVRVGSGVDCIDVDAATARGIIVANTPDALAGEVAEHAAALMLACVRRVPAQDRLVKRAGWNLRTVATQQRVRGKTLGLVGCGRIARELVKLLAGFRLTCLAYDPFVDSEVASQLGIRLVGLDELLKQADIVSLHVPLTEATRHLLGERELQLMKPQAVVINTARGAVVDQIALHKALSEGWIAGAGLDVMDPEPPSPDEPLLQLENVVLTPHSSAFSYEVRDAMYRAGCRAAIDVLEGRWPPSVVNPDVQPRWEADP
jgi:D-3-phosphoglycerate dehydrogenase